MKRIYELDALRGLGILLVVFFHTAWDICSEYNLEIINAPLITALVYLFAGMLIFISGVSSYLGKNTLKRSIIVLLCALGVTAVTYVLFPKNYIGFGILHLLGVSMLVSWVVKKFHIPNWAVLVFAAAVFITGLFAGKIHVETKWLFWLGFTTKNYAALDFYPLMPWLGVFLSGYLFSSKFYKEHTSPFTKGWYRNDILSFSGRHSLVIYVVHQPIAFLLVYYTPIKTLLDAIFK